MGDGVIFILVLLGFILAGTIIAISWSRLRSPMPWREPIDHDTVWQSIVHPDETPLITQWMITHNLSWKFFRASNEWLTVCVKCGGCCGQCKNTNLIGLTVAQVGKDG